MPLRRLFPEVHIFLKDRATVFWHRFNRFISYLSIFITYVSALIILLLYFKPNFPYENLIMLYVIALAAPIVAITIYFLIMIHCAFFPEKRRWFDKQFNYSEKELLPFGIRFANLEKEVDDIKYTLAQVVEEIKHGKTSRKDSRVKKTKKNRKA